MLSKMHFNWCVFLGVGKTSLVHLIMTGSSIAQPPQTIGCNVAVKVVVTFCIRENEYIGLKLMSFFVLFLSCSILLMEVLRTHQITSEATRTETSLLNSGIYQGMKDTMTADLYSILKLMVYNQQF